MQTDELIFDLELVDIVDGIGAFRDAAGKVQNIPLAHGGWRESIGRRGAAMREGSREGWRFRPYLDATLERFPESDEEGRLGWKCRAKPEGFTCPAWILPGEDGEFVEDECEDFQIRVPTEFLDLCDRYGVDVEDVIHGFIADAAGLMNWVRCPRADEFSSHGSDERMLAQEYIERTWRRG
ncbi:hypothetical protein [Azoarcus taiwanensis]|uniref:Uncharacterized protein n=1 Tax=Azoarcus taiwanensis TaxID=666964 RepID=A0A972FGF6_9RHOO|nr:hypothetical protein [Azoarcus taiwanensis]NMG05103.1 hypothetical protein [Azoarcus taiwanensis]